MKILKKAQTVLAAMVITPCLIVPAHAATILYGTLGSGGSNSTLVTIDVGTGAVTSIGAVGFSVNGLTWDSSTGTLYGSARADGGLLKINTATGAGTLVNGGFNSPASGCNSQNVLLASNSSGALFGWCDPSSDDLMSIDKVSGIATLLGDSGVGTGQHGLAFDNNDNLYMYNTGGSYYSIDTATGAAGSLGNGGVTGHHGDFNPDNNYYYGISSGIINIVDVVGNAGVIGSITSASSLHTLAFASDSTAIPEPGSMALFGLGLAGFAFSRRMKRGAAPAA